MTLLMSSDKKKSDARILTNLPSLLSSGNVRNFKTTPPPPPHLYTNFPYDSFKNLSVFLKSLYTG